jgi:hypothetical protein
MKPGVGLFLRKAMTLGNMLVSSAPHLARYACLARHVMSGRRVDGDAMKTEFARPLCRYPSYPRYRGAGDQSSPDSFNLPTELDG